MEQLNLMVTQRLLRDRNAQVVRDAELRRMQQERRSATTRPPAAVHPAAVRRGMFARLAEHLHLAHRRIEPPLADSVTP